MKAFNPDKELRKIQHRNKNRIILFIISLLMIGLIGYSFALYQVRYSKRIIYTKVAPFSNRDIELAVYVNGIKRDTFPTKEEKVEFYGLECDKENLTTATWDETKWGLNLFTSGPNKCDVIFAVVEEFKYNGSYYEYTIPKDGIYKIELWGANGGGTLGGKGGYTSGEINLKKEDILYIYIGGNNGYNGGGTSVRLGAVGGGATDVRLVEGTSWNDFASLKSRIMVAAGGGGWSSYGSSAAGGAGGGLIGVEGSPKSVGIVYGGSQTKGGTTISDYTSIGAEGAFGIGGNASNYSGYPYTGGGGGSGYYGGAGGYNIGQNVSSGGGGSSFISGHTGCDAIDENSQEKTITHTGESIHYSKKVFTKTVMIDGDGYRWTDTKEELVGVPTHNNSNGNGYARIALIKENIR